MFRLPMLQPDQPRATDGRVASNLRAPEPQVDSSVNIVATSTSGGHGLTFSDRTSLCFWVAVPGPEVSLRANAEREIYEIRQIHGQSTGSCGAGSGVGPAARPCRDPA